MWSLALLHSSKPASVVVVIKRRHMCASRSFSMVPVGGARKEQARGNGSGKREAGIPPSTLLFHIHHDF
jgi:hypothetical protein